MPFVEPRRRGVKPAPRYPFNPAFIRAIRASGQPLWLLALTSGFPNITTLSPMLYRRAVVATPQTIARLQRLANLIGYKDSLFVEESSLPLRPKPKLPPHYPSAFAEIPEVQS